MSNSRFNSFFLIILFISLIILNEFTLKTFFSEDGILEQNTKNLIRSFNFFQVTLFFLFVFINSFNKFIRINTIKYSKIIFFFLKSSLFILNKKNNLLLIICLFFFTFQIVSICIKYYKNTSYFDVIKADDMDAWDFLKITNNSSIYKNDKFLFYGPVYPKISKTLKTIISDKYSVDKYNNERLVNFSLYLLNLISILIICYLISIIFSSRIKDQVLFTYILFNCFLTNYLWAKYINFLRVDLFFTAIVCLIISIRARAYIKNSEYLTFLSYLMGGLAYNIKFLYVIFLPGFALFEILQKKKISYYISCLLFFLIGFIFFGFPESVFNLEKRIMLVNKISDLSAGYTIESISFWIQNFITSLLPIVFIIFILNIFGNQDKLKINKFGVLKFFLIFILPLVYFSKKIWQPTEHYIFPITASFLVILSYYIKSLSFLRMISKNIHNIFNLEALKYVILFFFIILSFSNLNKFNYIAHQNYKLKLVNEKNYHFVNMISQGKKVLVDGYVPYDFSLRNIKRYGNLQYTHQIVNKYNPEIMIIQKEQTELFLDKRNKPKYSNNSFFKSYEESYLFYNKLYNKKKFIYKNKKWNLIRKDKLIVWEIKDIIN